MQPKTVRTKLYCTVINDEEVDGFFQRIDGLLLIVKIAATKFKCAHYEVFLCRATKI